ncbi:MAG: radical SAM protein [Clostridia bacterium]|nr:radical SAM protein [Clostridia bacterium]
MEPYICSDCPHGCGALRGELGNGFCRMGADPVIARAAPHYDEEPVISGTRGSGAIFFSGCALRCRFCQNYPISHDGFGKKITVKRLRETYFELIGKGCHNINLVNPTHFAAAIDKSLEGGLPVPVVWNTGGYEKVETLRRLEGKIQVYLPDLKYIDPDSARKYSAARDYFDFAGPALKEMLRQTGPVELDEDGIIRRGTIVRHLILPGCAEESMRILDWIAENLPGAWVSLMAQYLPFGSVEGIDALDRRLFPEEYEAVVDHLMELGLEDGFVQELSSSDEKYIPAFDLTGVEPQKGED